MNEEKIITRIIRGERKRQGATTLNNIEINAAQQETLWRYNKYLVVQGRTFGTRAAYLRSVTRFVPFISGKRFEDVKQEDFNEYFYALKERKPATKEGVYVELHRFFRWLGELEQDNEDRYIKILKKERYKRPKGERHVIKAEDLPTRTEIDKIIKFAMNPRDKCMIAMSFDLGTRPSELLALNVEDVNFDEHGAVVTVGEHGKTGGRTLRLIASLPYLREWLESHPYRDNKESPLFIGQGKNQFGKRIQPQSLRAAFQEAANRAGIEKRIYTYLLRHASITREAGSGLGDQELKTFYGWTPSSRMLEVYSHLTSEDVNKKRLEQAGIIKPQKQPHELELRKCPRCDAENTPTADYCNKCSSALDEVVYREQQSKETELKELKEKVEELAEIARNTTPVINSPEVQTAIIETLKDNPEVLRKLLPRK